MLLLKLIKYRQDITPVNTHMVKKENASDI